MPHKQRKDVGIPAEEFEKAFGDDYWDRSHYERFTLLLNRVITVKSEQEHEARRNKNQRVHNGTESRD